MCLQNANLHAFGTSLPGLVECGVQVMIVTRTNHISRVGDLLISKITIRSILVFCTSRFKKSFLGDFRRTYFQLGRLPQSGKPINLSHLILSH